MKGRAVSGVEPAERLGDKKLSRLPHEFLAEVLEYLLGLCVHQSDFPSRIHHQGIRHGIQELAENTPAAKLLPSKTRASDTYPRVSAPYTMSAQYTPFGAKPARKHAPHAPLHAMPPFPVRE